MAQRIARRRSLAPGTREIRSRGISSRSVAEILHDVFTVTAKTTSFTAPDTVIDLGGACVVLVKCTLTAFTVDTETAGSGATDILVDLDDPTVSSDGSSFSAAGTAGGSVSGNMYTVNGYTYYVVSTNRYVKIPGPQIVFGTGSVYNGAHHPVATVQLDVYNLGAL